MQDMRYSAFIFCAALFSLGRTHAASIDCERCEEWNKEQAPFQIFGNTYYVGTRGLGAVLITSPQGHVLVDGGLPQSAPLIAKHIAQVGFKITDVKIILNSHAHYDHAGGIAELQKLSGAKVLASDAATQALKTGKGDPSDPQLFDLLPFPPVSHVQSINDSKTVAVGPISLSVIHTPGHAPGGTSWTWQSCEATRCLRIVYGDSLNAVADGSFKFSGDRRRPNAGAEMSRSFAALAAAQCDILITVHTEFTKLWSVFDEKGLGKREELIDAAACSRYADGARARFEKRLDSEKMPERAP
jgi:metallo-beta-lactamase class B